MIATADELSGIARLTHGDQRDARELRANLAAFARQTEDHALRGLISEVLAGRRDVREVFRTKEFTDILRTRLDRIEAGIAQLTDEERAIVFDRTRTPTPQATLDALRDGTAPEEPDRDADDPIMRKR
jgi:hypothetical protein